MEDELPGVDLGNARATALKSDRQLNSRHPVRPGLLDALQLHA
jgi:hypothetical protein